MRCNTVYLSVFLLVVFGCSRSQPDPDVEKLRAENEALRNKLEREKGGAEPKPESISVKKPRLTLASHKHVVHGAAFSPDGKRLATVSWDRTLKLWNADTGEEMASWGIPESTASVCFNSSGDRIAVNGDSRIVVFEATTGRSVFEAQPGRMTGNIVFSRDGGLLASGAITKDVTLLNATTGKPERILAVRSTEYFTEGAAFHPSAARVATGSHDGAIKIWDTANGSLLSTMQSPDQVHRLAYSPDGSRLAAGNDGSEGVEVWDTISGKMLFCLSGNNGREGVCFHPDGNIVAGCAGDQVVLWDLRTRRMIFKYNHPMIKDGFFNNEAHAVAFSPDGKSLVAAFGCGAGNVMSGHFAYVWSIPANLPPLPVVEVPKKAPSPYDLQRQAARHVRMKQFDQAIAIYTTLISDKAASADQFDYYRQRGVVYLEVKRYEDAIADLKKSLELKDKGAYLLGENRRCLIADAYLLKDDREAAVEAFTQVINHDTGWDNNVYPRLKRGLLYSQAKKHTEAVADYTVIIDGQYSRDYRAARARVFRADSYYAMAVYDKAAADYSKALELGLEGELKEHAERWLANARKASKQ